MDSNSLHAARLVAGYRLYPRLALFAGATFNVTTAQASAGEGFGLIRGVRLSADGAATTVRAWPGFVGGVQF